MSRDELDHRRFNQFLAFAVGCASVAAAMACGVNDDEAGTVACAAVACAMQLGLTKGFF